MKKKFFSLLLVSLFVVSMSASVFAIGGDDPHIVKPKIAIQQVLPVDK